MSRLLTDEEIQRQLQDLQTWTYADGVLRRSVEFTDFPTALRGVVDVGEEAETMDHHPDMDIRWRTVHFTLSTHSAGGVTQLDIELAHRIDRIVTSLGS